MSNDVGKPWPTQNTVNGEMFATSNNCETANFHVTRKAMIMQVVSHAHIVKAGRAAPATWYGLALVQ